jgi:hypothetical protein
MPVTDCLLALRAALVAVLLVPLALAMLFAA